MAHKTLIGGTVYEASAGKTLVDGTAYYIVGGKALVDGTAYNIDLGVYCTITVTGSSDRCSMWINGIQYNSPSTVTVPHGTQVNFIATGSAGRRVNFNGTKVSSSTSDTEDLYIHTVTSNLSVALTNHSFFDSEWGVVSITEA